MKSKLQSIISAIKAKPKLYAVLAIVFVIVVGLILKKGAPKIEEITVIKGTITQEVSVTGKTVAVQDVTLGFEKSGKVVSAPVSVGSRVKVGDTLAVLDQTQLLASLTKAEANLSQEKVSLEQTKRKSGDSFQTARDNIISSIRDSYSKSDDAIRNNIDTFFRNQRQSSNYIEFTFVDVSTTYTFPIESDLRLKINAERYQLELLLNSWQKSLNKLSQSSSNSEIEPYILQAESNLNRIKAFINDVAFAANSLTASEFKYESTIAGYKATVSDSRTAIATALSNLVLAREKFTSAPRIITDGSGLGSSFDDVLIGEAKVRELEAEVKSVESELNDTVVRSPIDGIVTFQDAKVGQIVTSGQKLVSVISDSNLEIEANVSEVNIGKVNIGNDVVITFDAFPGKTFGGKVFYIEPAETILDNVVNYRIKVSITGDTPGLKSGLTANLKLKTAIKENVLKIPQYAISVENGNSVIHTLSGKNENVIKVTTGIVGNDGMIEIIDGLSEGEILKVSLIK